MPNPAAAAFASAAIASTAGLASAAIASTSAPAQAMPAMQAMPASAVPGPNDTYPGISPASSSDPALDASTSSSEGYGSSDDDCQESEPLGDADTDGQARAGSPCAGEKKKATSRAARRKTIRPQY